MPNKKTESRGVRNALPSPSELQKRGLFYEIQHRSFIISALLIITVQFFSLIIITVMMVASINEDAQSTADELAHILKIPMYNVADDQCRRIGESFLASGRISGITIDSTATGRIMNRPPGSTETPLIPSVERTIRYNGYNLGTVTLFFSHRELVTTLRRFIIIMLAVIATFLISHTAAERFAVQRKVHTIFSKVIRNIDRIASGDYTSRLEETGYSDFDSIIHTLNLMSGRVEEKNAQLMSLNENLEKKVAERTAELTMSLEQTRKMQEKLVEGEKLSVLGELSAGIAHELNTPLGAVLSSAGSLERFFDDTLLFDTRIIGTFSQKETALLYEILEHGFEGSKDLTIPVSSRVRVRELRKKLSEAGIEESEKLAYYLAECGIDGIEDKVIQNLGNPNDVVLLKAASEMIAARRMVQVVRSSSTKASEVVRALRSYLASGNDDTPEKVGIHDTLQEAITILQNVLKYGISLKMDIEELYCTGISDKLCRIWINIITNAVQAMNGRGRIKIRAKAIGNSALVTISNDGPPVPENIRSNIFEPFFTTKKSTGGMGLGLDICRRLVSSFNGRLYYSYDDGWNVFTVELPLYVD